MGDYCCGALKQAVEDYDFPFERPITWDRETLALHADMLAIRLSHKTKAGNLQRKGQLLVRFNYCPFCGKAVAKEER